MLSIGLLFACSDKSEELSTTDENTTEVKKTDEKPDATKQEIATEASEDASSNPDNDPVFTVVEQMPTYDGGNEAMFAFIQKNISYPEEAQKAGIQ